MYVQLIVLSCTSVKYTIFPWYNIDRQYTIHYYVLKGFPAGTTVVYRFISYIRTNTTILNYCIQSAT